LQGSTEFWPLAFVRGIWGREALRRRIESLEGNLGLAKRLLASFQESNKSLSIDVTRLEGENRQLTELVKKWEEANKRIDPNAQCPVCGGRDGHLETIHKMEGTAVAQVVCRNICHICGNKFISAEPVAGAQFAAQAYQPDIYPVTILPPLERK
jgi:hypothetical protein